MTFREAATRHRHHSGPARVLPAATLLLVVALLAGCKGETPEQATPFAPADTTLATLPSGTGTLEFLVIGDWGRDGRYYQQDVAHVMAVVAGKVHAAFVATTGDNFYEAGVSSTRDEQWQLSFEDVYDAPSLAIPWYPSLGNHDHRGNVRAEIDYTRRSSRWEMPARYYSIVRSIDDSTAVRLIFLDTTPLQALGGKAAGVTGYEAVTQLDPQLAWLAETLAHSSARWNLVFGHHPVYSSGAHGDSQVLIHVLKPILDHYHVPAYFAGHDHDLEVLRTDHRAYFITGAGSRVRTVGTQRNSTFSVSRPGFVLVSLAPARLLAQLVDYEGNILYGTIVGRPATPPVFTAVSAAAAGSPPAP